MAKCGDCGHFKIAAPSRVLGTFSKAAKTAVRSQGYCLKGKRPVKAGINEPSCSDFCERKAISYTFYILTAAAAVIAVAALFL
jgi:hypothetical protein